MTISCSLVKGFYLLPNVANQSFARLRANTLDLLVSSISSIFIRVMKEHVVSISPQVMGGTPVFEGTRVPVQTLIDYLEAGESINDFLKGFPTVSREQVIQLLEEAKEKVLVPA